MLFRLDLNLFTVSAKDSFELLISGVLGWQACTTTQFHVVLRGKQGFLHAGQAPYQLTLIPTQLCRYVKADWLKVAMRRKLV